MKKLFFAGLCLCLVGCGTFAIKVEIVARDTPTGLPGSSLTQAWATTYAAASAYPADPQGQSRILTQAAATLQSAGGGSMGVISSQSAQATQNAIETATPGSDLNAYGTRVWSTIEALSTSYADDPTRLSAALTQSAATLQAEVPVPAGSLTPSPLPVTPTPWALQDGQPLELDTVDMADVRDGWGVESTGHIVRTGDGGWTWKDVTPVQAVFNRHGLYAFNTETVWVAPARLDLSNVVWATRDGGVTWEASQPIQLGEGEYTPLGLQFPDARHGWLLLLARNGSSTSRVLLFKTANGGMDWLPVTTLNDSQTQSYLPDTNTTMTFFDGQTGWLGGWWGKDDPNQWLVLKTVDGGSHWQTDELPLPKLNALACDGHPIADMQPGSMAVEMSCTLPNDPKYLYHHVFYLSTRISPSWRTWELSGDFLGANFINASQGWMMVASDTPRLNEIQSTRDRGKDWTSIGEVSWALARFDFVDVKDGWAVVGNGFGTALVHTENGGKIWIQIRPVAGQ